MPSKLSNNASPKPSKTIAQLQAEAWLAPMSEAEMAKFRAIPKRPFNPNSPGAIAGRKALVEVDAKFKAMAQARANRDQTT